MPLLGAFYASKKMTIQTVNLGAAPTGAGGDTFRSTGAKINENFTNNNHAASRLVGTAAGNVMEVGAFGVGKSILLGSQKLSTLREMVMPFIGKIMVIIFQVLETILTTILRQLLI